MEKLGVVLDEDLVKTGSQGTKVCPGCGRTISRPKCDSCGTKPFEKKPEEAPKK